MRVVVCVPFRAGDDPARDRNWKAVRAWYEQHHPDWPIYVGTDDTRPFFACAHARNDAVRQAGDFDVAVLADADTICHPDAVREAVQKAAATNELVFAADGHIYSDELSTQRFIDTGLLFPKPTDWPDTQRKRFAFDEGSVYRDPSGGVYAIGYQLWATTGGYVDSLGSEDSHEDLVYFAQCQLFGSGGGVNRVAGLQIHLYHPPAPRIRGRNHQHYHQLLRIMGRPNAQQRARDYLITLGHVMP